MRNLTQLIAVCCAEMDDEMPQAPAGGAAAAAPVKEFTGEIEYDVYSKVAEMGDALPQGTYMFRLDSAKPGWSDEPKPGDKEYGYGAQPYFNVKWVAQEEPITGRAFFEYVPWVSDEVAAKANSGDAGAQAIVNDRIWKLKTIASASGYKPPAGSKFNPKKFLESQPQVKISLTTTEKKQRDGVDEKGAAIWKGTGQQKNKASAYHPPFGQTAR